MSFDMSSILSNTKSKKLNDRKRNISSLFVFINELDNISNQTKNALTVYLTHRLETRGADKLSVARFNTMVTELLEKCCDKSLFEITPDDTDINFDKILYHLKFAIKHNFRFKIYHDEYDDFDTAVARNSGKITYKNRQLSKQEIEKIFEGW